MKNKLGVPMLIVLALLFGAISAKATTASANHVTVSLTSRLGSQLIAAVSSLRNAQNQIIAIDGIMGQCVYNDGTQTGGVNYSVLETQFGITGNGAADNTSVGYNVKYQFDSVATAPSLANIAQLLAQLG